MWSDHSHLHLGGMLGASGKRMRRIAGQLKRDVVAAVDECMGEGHHEDKPAFGWNGCAGWFILSVEAFSLSFRWRYRGRRRSRA